MHAAPVEAKRYVFPPPPLWPFNDAAKPTAPAPNHPDLTGEQIEIAKVPNPDVDDLATANKSSLSNPLTPSIPVVVFGEGELVLSSNGSSSPPREN